MIEVGRSSVQTWECDVVGHLNSQFYVERATEGATILLSKAGLGPRLMATRSQRLEPVDQHMRFLSEIKSWQSYSVIAGSFETGSEEIGIYCELIADEGSRVAAAISTSYRLCDLHSGRPVSSPDAILEKLAAIKAVIPDHGLPRGIAADDPVADADMALADALGMRTVAMAVVKPSECDHCGLLLPRFFTAHFINGITALQRPDTPYPDGFGAIGGAAVENRVVYRRWPRAGDALVIRSAITFVDARRYNWVHWMFNLETGELLASNEAVAICIDMDRRMHIPPPPHFHADLAGRANPNVRI